MSRAVTVVTGTVCGLPNLNLVQLSAVDMQVRTTDAVL